MTNESLGSSSPDRDPQARIQALITELRCMQVIAGQASVEAEGIPAEMAAAEADRCREWADVLETGLLALSQQLTAKEQEIARLTLERDSAREQFDRHVEWASKQAEALQEQLTAKEQEIARVRLGLWDVEKANTDLQAQIIAYALVIDACWAAVRSGLEPDAYRDHKWALDDAIRHRLTACQQARDEQERQAFEAGWEAFKLRGTRCGICGAEYDDPSHNSQPHCFEEETPEEVYAAWRQERSDV